MREMEGYPIDEAVTILEQGLRYERIILKVSPFRVKAVDLGQLRWKMTLVKKEINN
jgi:hypothetical protein